MKRKTENLKLIAKRLPPGDRWILVDENEESAKNSMVEALSAYCAKTGFKGDYKLCPMEPQTEKTNGPTGCLYSIEEVEEEVVPKGYNIYGEMI